MQHLCRELDRIRQRKNLTMQDICRETKFSKTTVSDCMGRPHKGRRSNPRLATLCRVSEFLGVELRVLEVVELDVEAALPLVEVGQ